MWSIFKTKKLLNKLPRNPLTNIDIKKYVKILKIPNFRGVFMRNKLPRLINRYESGIINLDNHYGPGTHWTAYIKNNNHINYFDSFGNLRPSTELVTYFLSDGSKNKIIYNHMSYQSYNTENCGQLCLQFLYKNSS